ncbi:MAG: hypothetical protein HQL14_07280 [Candidatus Omnitrophica bacterium]|nr:hypothetical protein [Candidatus Omnitrophota bacterium]
MNPIKTFINKNPAVLLLFFVYLFFLPHLLSYDYAWMFPEEFFCKKAAIKNGPQLQWQDLKSGMDWWGFEEGTFRITRPLSSYFEILDTKFRCWLWHFMPPHPSVSLTWIFSFIGAPVFLYRLMRYWKVSQNTALAMTAFYLMTPAVMSYAVMLFRPAKPMANFFIILCLYQASNLQKKFLDHGKPIPPINYMVFWVISTLSFYWDETIWVIIPALLVLFPRVLICRKSYLWAWLSLPFVTTLFYFKIIPFLTVLAGYDYADVIRFKGSLRQLSNFPIEFLLDLAGNAKSLVFDTMGIMVPDVFKASLWIKAVFGISLAAWGVIWFYLLRIRWPSNWWAIFLGGLLLFFNYLMTILVGVWGPYYYGAFWSIFFVLWLGLWIQQSRISRFVLTVCFIPIFLSMFYGFSAINRVYKLQHYYPYNPTSISQYFAGKKSFFDTDRTLPFSGSELEWYAKSYWLALKQRPSWAQLSCLPSELYWLKLELEPDKRHTRYELDTKNTHIPTLIFDFY